MTKKITPSEALAALGAAKTPGTPGDEAPKAFVTLQAPSGAVAGRVAKPGEAPGATIPTLSVTTPERSTVLAFVLPKGVAAPTRLAALSIVQSLCKEPGIRYAKDAWEGRDYIVSKFGDPDAPDATTIQMILSLKGDNYQALPLSAFAIQTDLPSGWKPAWPDWSPEGQSHHDKMMRGLAEAARDIRILRADAMAQGHKGPAAMLGAALDAFDHHTTGHDNPTFKAGERVKTVEQILADLK